MEGLNMTNREEPRQVWCATCNATHEDRRLTAEEDGSQDARQIDEALAAANEPNRRVVAQVWCAGCKEAESPLAEVRRSSAGLIWDTIEHVSDDGVRLDRERKRGARSSGWRHEEARVVGRTVVLLDRPNEQRDQYPLRVMCPHGHGAEQIDAVDLRRRIRRSPPVKITIN
jgi:hypothetical protein